MKIKVETDTRLVLEYRPILFALLWAGVSFGIFATGVLNVTTGRENAWFLLLFSLPFMGATFLILSRARLTIDVTEGLAIYRRKTAFKSVNKAFELENIARFAVQATSNSDGRVSERLAMHLGKENNQNVFPLTRAYYAPWPANDIKDRANTWLYDAKISRAEFLAAKAAANRPPAPKPDVIFE